MTINIFLLVPIGQRVLPFTVGGTLTFGKSPLWLSVVDPLPNALLVIGGDVALKNTKATKCEFWLFTKDAKAITN